MQTGDANSSAVWEVLWASLDAGRYDIDGLKARAGDDWHLADDIGMDSLDVLEFYLRLDEKFEVSLTEEDYSDLTSVAAVVAFLRRKAA
jgi:acyl carrier protein